MDKIGIIGIGNMGEAIVKTLLKNGVKKESILCSEIKPERVIQIENMYNVKFVEKIEEMIKKSHLHHPIDKASGFQKRSYSKSPRLLMTRR